jgi:hypothetical protein
MPTSTLLQLIARGRQDVYLTGAPQFTFFKQVFRRYTPFAIESIPIEWDGNPDFGRRISTLIPRKAELLSSMFIEVELPPFPVAEPGQPQKYWTNDIGHVLIQDITIEIGEREIDTHTGEWLAIWGELTTPADKRDGYNEMVGHWNAYPPSSGSFNVSEPLQLTIPLRFWFCNTIGAALPLIALQAHPVRLICHLAPFQNCWWDETFTSLSPGDPCPTTTPLNITRFQLFGDYIFLDKPERQRFAAAEHEYLITQLQINPVQSVTAGVASANIPLFFNHCCREFIWTVQEVRMQAAHEWFNYSNRLEFNGGEALYQADLLESALIRLDGYDRFYRRGARYFRITQPYQRHTHIPTPPMNLYIYAFDLHPEDDQPSGSLNASKIDDIVLNLQFNPSYLGYERYVNVYATNYNVLRIVGGLGGLAFIA